MVLARMLPSRNSHSPCARKRVPASPLGTGHVKGHDVIGRAQEPQVGHWAASQLGRPSETGSLCQSLLCWSRIQHHPQRIAFPLIPSCHSIEAFSYIPHLDRYNLSRDHVSDKSHFHAVAIISNP